MLPISVGELATRLGGTLHSNRPDGLVKGFAWDSSDVQPGTAFLAIRGARADGHDFVGAAEGRGATAAIVERPVETNHILVTSLVEGLARMASSFRDEFSGPVIGITGSAGKTTTKELTAAAVSPLGKVLKSPGNKNTEYTSPLTWADIEPNTDVAVVELAMRGFGQIQHLAGFARPTVGMITNIGFSHLEQVGSREGIAHAKGELFDALPTGAPAILWKEDPYFELLTSKVKGGNILTFGYSDGCDSQLTDYEQLSWDRCILRGNLVGTKYEVELPIAGRHLALNAAAACLAAAAVDVDALKAVEAMKSVVLPPLRMETMDFRGAKVLMDNYNASPASMVAAIETFCETPCSGRRFAIIGEMKELGSHLEEGHRAVGKAIASHDLDLVAFIGEPMEMARDEAVANGMSASKFFFAKDRAELRVFLDQVREGDAVLVKGSRALELERIFQPEGA